MSSSFDEVVVEQHNNTTSVVDPFVQTNGFSVLVGLASFEDQAAPAIDGDIYDFILDVYPVERAKLYFGTRKHYEFASSVSFWESLDLLNKFYYKAFQILNRHNQMNAGDQREKMLLFGSQNFVNTLLGAPGCGGFASGINGTIAFATNRPVVVAHELGHTLGLMDTYGQSPAVGPPNPRRSDAKWEGNVIEDGNVNLNEGKIHYRNVCEYLDFMGTASNVNRWTDRPTWEHLYFNKFEASSAKKIPLHPNGYIAVCGAVSKNDSSRIFPVIRLDNVPTVSASDSGAYRLEFHDPAGAILDTFHFHIDFYVLDAGEVSQQFFSCYLPLIQNTSGIVLKKNDTVLTRRDFSLNPPIIVLLSPSDGDSLQETEIIRWSASDIDGDSLFFDILYSPDGEEQIIIDTEIRDDSYTWDPSDYPGSPQGTITVIASDGFNEASASVKNLILSWLNEKYGPATTPVRYVLKQNYPNPFNNYTCFPFTVPRPGRVRLDVFDLLGNRIDEVLDEYKRAGDYTIEWNAQNHPSGIYLLRLETDYRIETRKFVIQK